ncbi:MAG: beta-lactamase superfamily II metal-dependent hydrolase [Planctomycetota bacterium]
MGAQGAQAGELSLHFIDVGQASSTLVVGPDGTTVLFDGGDPGDGNDYVVPYLSSLGLTGLDYSIMSHWHTDHYGGLDEVFNSGFLPSVAAYDRGSNDNPSGTQATQYFAAVGTKRTFAQVGDVLQLGDGATLEFVAVNGVTPLGSDDPSNYSQSENGRSIAVVVRYNDFDFYIGGDITSGGSGTADVESMAAQYIGQVEVAQSSHHGSKTSSGPLVISNLAPSLVIHSCGLNNSFFHPAADVVEDWSSSAATRAEWGTTRGDTDNGSGGWTSAEGTIIVRTGGYRFTAETANDAAAAGGEELMEFATFENPEASPIAGGLAITEIMANPGASSDTYGEYIELTNLTPNVVDLGGVRFLVGLYDFTLSSRVLLDYNERIVLGVDGHAARNGDLWIPLSGPFGDLHLVNSSATLEVRAPNGVVIDTVSWGTGGIPVNSGKSSERVDPFAPGTPANFQTATTPFGAGDLGSPGFAAPGETGVWPTGLTIPGVHIGDVLDLRLAAPAHPGSLYLLSLSTGFAPGIDAIGLHVPLNIDPLFQAFLNVPGSLSNLDSNGAGRVVVPVGNDPALVGLLLFGAYVTFTADGSGIIGTSVSNLGIISIL